MAKENFDRSKPHVNIGTITREHWYNWSRRSR